MQSLWIWKSLKFVIWEKVNYSTMQWQVHQPFHLTHYHTIPHFDALKIYIAVENCVRKGEIACNKQYLLFSQCFLTYMALIFHVKCTLTHSQTTTPFDAPWKQAFWKHCRKRRNCSWAISPFPTVFSTRLDNFLPFSSNLTLSSANSFSLEESKIYRLVMG